MFINSEKLKKKLISQLWSRSSQVKGGKHRIVNWMKNRNLYCLIWAYFKTSPSRKQILIISKGKRKLDALVCTEVSTNASFRSFAFARLQSHLKLSKYRFIFCDCLSFVNALWLEQAQSYSTYFRVWLLFLLLSCGDFQVYSWILANSITVEPLCAITSRKRPPLQNTKIFPGNAL